MNSHVHERREWILWIAAVANGERYRPGPPTVLSIGTSTPEVLRLVSRSKWRLVEVKVKTKVWLEERVHGQRRYRDLLDRRSIVSRPTSDPWRRNPTWACPGRWKRRLAPIETTKWKATRSHGGW